MNRTHFGFYLIRFSGEKPVFLVAMGPLSGEFWWKRIFLGSILDKVFYLDQGLCAYQKWDLSKTIFTLILPKVTVKYPVIGPQSDFFQSGNLYFLRSNEKILCFLLKNHLHITFCFFLIMHGKILKIKISYLDSD